MSAVDTPNDPLVDVVVKIRESRLAEFYGVAAQFTRPAPATPEHTDPTTWTAGDAEQAAAVWEKLSPLARKMFERLAYLDGNRLSAKDLMRDLDLKEPSQVAGALAWPRQHAHAVGRPLPVSAKVTDEGTFYWMDPPAAAVFREVGA